MGLPGVEVREESWSDHVPAAPYNSIISIGAFEHFARPCSRPVRVRGYRDFFERCHGWLNPGGWMSLQSIGLGTADRGIEGQFVAENIFPESARRLQAEPGKGPGRLGWPPGRYDPGRSGREGGARI
jgi:cyclopropane-fatty-acyl-phospholipid synthase